MTYSDIKVSPCILLVEDEPGLQQTLKILLEAEGYHIIIAHHGQDALNILGHNRPDLIMTDNMMPVMDGLTMIGEIRQLDQFKDIPILLSSAVDISKADLSNIKADEFLLKPVELAGLLETLARLLVSRGR